MAPMGCLTRLCQPARALFQLFCFVWPYRTSSRAVCGKKWLPLASKSPDLARNLLTPLFRGAIGKLPAQKLDLARDHLGSRMARVEESPKR